MTRKIAICGKCQHENEFDDDRKVFKCKNCDSVNVITDTVYVDSIDCLLETFEIQNELSNLSDEDLYDEIMDICIMLFNDDKKIGTILANYIQFGYFSINDRKIIESIYILYHGKYALEV